MVMIRAAAREDLDAWARLRAMLWTDASPEEHAVDIRAGYLNGDPERTAFVAADGGDEMSGFVEAALRHDYVNGCDTSPVAFVEGLFVRPECRGEGLGRQLCTAVEAWARDRGCTEIASDALLENAPSQRFHAAIGFEETERVVYFRKVL